MHRFLFLVACLLHATYASKFTVNIGDINCGGDFTIDSINVDCGGDYCEFGKDISVSGSVSILNDLSGEPGSVRVSLLSNMVTIYSSDDFDPCKGLKSESGAACASAGDYSFETNYKIPGNENAWYSSLMFSSWFNVYASFDLDGSTSYCSISLKASKNGGYQMSNSMQIAGGAIAIVGLVTCSVYRKRRVALIDIDEGDSDAPQADFEMLPERWVPEAV
jgi:hypothetical protein